jgi:hypothetical protein
VTSCDWRRRPGIIAAVRRIAHHLFTLCAAVSLLLCVYAAVAAAFHAREGGPYLRGYDLFQPLEPPRRFTAAEIDTYRPPPPAFSFAGFRVQRGFRATYTIRHGRVFTVPFWFLALVFAVPPWLWVRTRLRPWREARAARLIAAGICPACGYDLRATSGRCPECGADATPAAA